MTTEIERRWLVDVLPECLPETYEVIRQHYAEGAPLRLRATAPASDEPGGRRFFLTSKETIAHGVNTEHEIEVPMVIYNAIRQALPINSPTIVKYRFRIPHGDQVIEVDVFPGRRLIIAEIELGDINEPVDVPGWFGREITGEPQYSNYALAKTRL